MMRNIITPPSLLQQPYLVDGGQDSMTNVITDDDGCEFWLMFGTTYTRGGLQFMYLSK